jgi:hypothetical protein
MAVLRGITNDLTGSEEFVATQRLAKPAEAKVVRGEKNGMPVTDGISPESKEFLPGYWIVDVATPEPAYAIAGRISAAPGPGGALRTCRLKSGGSRFMSNLSPNDGMPIMRRALRGTFIAQVQASGRCGHLIGFKPSDHDHILRSHYRKTAGLLVFRLEILLESEAGAT